MKKICIVGHYGIGKEMFNGQTIKTKEITEELENKFGKNQVVKIDTHGGIRKLPIVIMSLLKHFNDCKNIIILPGQNGIRILAPVCVALNKFYNRKLHYIVIGGWLNEFLDKHKMLERKIKKFNIYVETIKMMKTLELKGMENVHVMPNFKNIEILSEDELIYANEIPYKVCTFSRVMKEKGIEVAAEAVKKVNDKYGKDIFLLDIYGQIDNKQEEWFEDLLCKYDEYIQYKGVIPFNQSVQLLKNYFALLFPTFYEGEGFAGTLIDAMAAGVPVIASDWKYNDEIIVPGVTGILIKDCDSAKLKKELIYIKEHNEQWNNLKSTSLVTARQYIPKQVMKILLNELL